MGETSIAWTHYTFNPWWGCTEVSPGCANCYARTLAHRYGHEVWGAGSSWRFFGDKHWDEPQRWARLRLSGDPRFLVFVASMADVLEDARELDAPRERVWTLMESLYPLTFLLLTKRPENAPKLLPLRWMRSWPRNVVFGVTAENQALADRRVPMAVEMKQRTGCRLMVSYEPALSAVAFHRLPAIDQVIFGGESGAGARPCSLEWAADTLAACRQAGTAFFMKQAGSKAGLSGKGDNPSEWPEALRVQEVPW